MREALKRFVWRVKFTLYGQRKTGWGWGNWWEWSAIHYDECDGAEVGWEESADDLIDAAMA